MNLERYAKRIAADLTENILPFWIHRVFDPSTGSFHGELSNDLKINPTAERGALLTTRILWTYSAASLEYANRDYQVMAEAACRDLIDRYQDNRHGGWYWSTSPDGKTTNKRKQTYLQAFAIYALSTYYQASQHEPALALALDTFRLIEQKTRDVEGGGYIEAFDEDWARIADVRLSEVDLNAPKSQNTHLHLMEAFTALLRVTRDPQLVAAQKSLLEIMLDRVLDESGQHLRLFFNESWEPLTDVISYGHDIEAAWLLTEAAEVLGDPILTNRTRAVAAKIAETTLQIAIDTDGGLLYEGNPREGVTNFKKEWWPQAEAVVGFINAYEITRNRKFLETALGLWEFIEHRLIDHRHGEWFRSTDQKGAYHQDVPKVSFWKCPYHNGRLGLEAPRRLRNIAIQASARNAAPAKPSSG